jgi:hypothetical protein
MPSLDTAVDHCTPIGIGLQHPAFAIAFLVVFVATFLTAVFFAGAFVAPFAPAFVAILLPS